MELFRQQIEHLTREDLIELYRKEERQEARDPKDAIIKQKTLAVIFELIESKSHTNRDRFYEALATLNLDPEVVEEITQTSNNMELANLMGEPELAKVYKDIIKKLIKDNYRR